MTSTRHLHTAFLVGLLGLGALVAACDADVSASTSGSPSGTAAQASLSVATQASWISRSWILPEPSSTAVGSP